MGLLYEDYCYATIDEAARSEMSSSTFLDLTGLLAPRSYTVSTSNSVYLVFKRVIFGTPGESHLGVTRFYSSCSDVGYQHNFSGLTLSDVTELSWLVVAVWASAWAIKTMRGRS
jgi:hypothetical protein